MNLRLGAADTSGYDYFMGSDTGGYTATDTQLPLDSFWSNVPNPSYGTDAAVNPSPDLVTNGYWDWLQPTGGILSNLLSGGANIYNSITQAENAQKIADINAKAQLDAINAKAQQDSLRSQIQLAALQRQLSPAPIVSAPLLSTGMIVGIAAVIGAIFLLKK